MEDNVNNNEVHEEIAPKEIISKVQPETDHTEVDPSPSLTQSQENSNAANKKETGEKKERRITRLLTFWKKREKTKDPISEENGAEQKNSPETERKRAHSPSEVRKRAGSILKIFKPRSKSSISPKKGKIEHENNLQNVPKTSHDDTDLPKYRSYEQFERATAFQKSISVQAIDMSDELLLAKQEYIRLYNSSIDNNGTPLQKAQSFVEGSNNIVSEKRRGRGDSIRKEDFAKLPVPGPFFGVEVDSMYKFPGQKIPAFLALLITHIIKHGPRVRDLFAKDKILIAQVQKLKTEFENASQQDIIHRKEILMNADIHTVVGLLLTWLNNLPSPLATVAVCEKLRFPIAVNHGQFSHSLIQSILYNSLQPTQRRSFLYIISFLKQMIKLHDEQLHVKSPRPSDAYPLSEPRHSISVSEGPLSIDLIKRDLTTTDNTKTDSETTPRDESQTSTANGETSQDQTDKKEENQAKEEGTEDKKDQSEAEKKLNETTDKAVTEHGEISRSESESMIYFGNNESTEESEERITMEKEFDNFLADFEAKYEELFRKSFTNDDYSSLLQEVDKKLDASFDSQVDDSFDLVEISKLFSESMFQISNHVAETANAISNLEQTLNALQETVKNSDVEDQELKRQSLMQNYQEKTLEHQNMQQLRLGVMHYFLTEDILAEESGAVYLKSEKSTERFLAEAPKKVLIYKLLDHEYQSADPTYVDAFLLTYRYALPSSQLLSELIELYPKDNCMELSQQTFDLRIRVCTIIKKWTESYFYEMAEERDFIKVLRSFVKNCSNNLTVEEQEFFRYFWTSIETWHEVETTGHLRNLYNFPDFSTHAVSPTTVTRVTEVDPIALASTLTLMDHQLFCNITMQEFLTNNNPITSLNSKQVVLFAKQSTALVQRTDKVLDWVMKEIFDASDSKEKVATIKHFIKVAQECLQIYNYNGCYAIVSALNQNDIQNTIAKLHDKIGSHNIIALNSMLDIFNPKDVFANYQKVMSSSETPCVPWIGLYQKYLSHLEETEPTFKSRANRIVNFNKMRKIYQLLQHIKKYQDSLYNYQLDVTTLLYLLSVFNRPKFRPHLARQEDKESKKKKKK